MRNYLVAPSGPVWKYRVDDWMAAMVLRVRPVRQHSHSIRGFKSKPEILGTESPSKLAKKSVVGELCNPQFGIRLLGFRFDFLDLHMDWKLLEFILLPNER